MNWLIGTESDDKLKILETKVFGKTKHYCHRQQFHHISLILNNLAKNVPNPRAAVCLHNHYTLRLILFRWLLLLFYYCCVYLLWIENVQKLSPFVACCSWFVLCFVQSIIIIIIINEFLSAVGVSYCLSILVLSAKYSRVLE